MRTLIKLVIAGLIVHGVFRAGTSYMTYYTFRDELRQIAQFSAGRSERELHARAMEIANEMNVPVDAARLAVRKDRDHTFINASYETGIELLPRYYHPWRFNVSIDAWTFTVRQAGDSLQR